ncbi:MAG: flagella basal body P-ring formation protein FlgA [Candidatus Acidiferrales bacterium]
MQRANKLIAWIAAVLVLAPATLAAELASRVALSPALVAHSESIRISDLLPPDAPENVRARATRLTLGEAPLPGSHRTFARAQVERALRASPELRNAFLIPPSIEVTRWSRSLTREEVLEAIVEALRSNQLAVPSSLLSRDLVFSSSVAVTEDAPRLRVTRIEPSPDGVATHVRLSTPSEPHTPSFWVTLLRNIGAGESVVAPDLAPAEPRSLSAPLEVRYTASRPTSAPKPVPLVRVGDRVELILQAQGMRLSARATALEIGSLGQKVRVRNSDTGKILSGTIVAAHTIEAEF